MTSLKVLFVIFSLLLLNDQANVQVQDEWVSPCPRLFVYEGKSNEPDKWYGVLTLLSDTNLQGTWLRIILDRPSLQLGNWFGQVSTSDNIDYHVKNRNNQIKAHVPQTVRFFIKYNPNEPPPKLVSFRLNARTVCPEEAATETPPATMELQTSSEFGSTPNPMRPGGGSGGGGNSGGGGGEGGSFNRPGGGGGGFFRPPASGESSGENEDVYPSDFYNFFNKPAPETPTGNADLNSICGTVVAQPRPLIKYGQPTEEGEYPWHAALYHAKGIGLDYICGASLISKYHAITVAHCVTRRLLQTPLNPDDLVVYLGKYYLKRFSSAGVQDRQVSQILPHPQYNAQTYGNDIALIKFATAAEFTDYVRPVCLWQESPDLTSVLGKQGNVVGWGFDETGKVTEQLMKAKMPIVSQEICIYSFPDFYSRFTSNNTFCAGFKNGTSVCNGDSGGGMVFPKPNSNKNNSVWQLRGLVSISVALQNQFKCDASHYVVFTDAAKYLDWIKKSIAK